MALVKNTDFQVFPQSLKFNKSAVKPDFPKPRLSWTDLKLIIMSILVNSSKS